MLKKHMAACLVASAFITMPVLAQTGTSPGATSPGATQPATGASGGATGAGSGSAASGASGRFINQQQTNQWRASRLIGLDVYGADNNKIGDINEVLVDRQGNADAVVIGVGGFLGIGEKNVALPFNAFEWAMDDTRRTASAGGTGAGGSGAGGAGSGAGAGMGTAGTTGSGATGTTATTGAGTGAAGTAGASRSDTTASTSAAGGSGSSARSGAERGYPDHAVLRMTKAEIENAPTFTYVGETRSESGGAARTGSGAGGGSGSGGSATGGGTAPRQ